MSQRPTPKRKLTAPDRGQRPTIERAGIIICKFAHAGRCHCENLSAGRLCLATRDAADKVARIIRGKE